MMELASYTPSSKAKNLLFPTMVMGLYSVGDLFEEFVSEFWLK